MQTKAQSKRKGNVVEAISLQQTRISEIMETNAGKFPAEDRNQTGQKKEKHSKREAAEETADFSNHHDRKGFLSDSI